MREGERLQRKKSLVQCVFVCATGRQTVIYTVIGVQRENGVTLQQGTLYLLSSCCSHQMEQSIPSLQ